MSGDQEVFDKVMDLFYAGKLRVDLNCACIDHWYYSLYIKRFILSDKLIGRIDKPDECYSDQVIHASGALSGLNKEQIKLILKTIEETEETKNSQDDMIARNEFLK